MALRIIRHVITVLQASDGKRCPGIHSSEPGEPGEGSFEKCTGDQDPGCGSQKRFLQHYHLYPSIQKIRRCDSGAVPGSAGDQRKAVKVYKTIFQRDGHFCTKESEKQLQKRKKLPKRGYQEKEEAKKNDQFLICLFFSVKNGLFWDEKNRKLCKIHKNDCSK